MKKRATPLVLDPDTPKRVEHITQSLSVEARELTSSRKVRRNCETGRKRESNTEILVERLGISTRTATYSGNHRYVRVPLGDTDVRLAFRSSRDKYGIGVFARNSRGKDRIHENRLHLVSLGLAEHVPSGKRTDPPLEFYEDFSISGTSDQEMLKLIAAIEELYGANVPRIDSHSANAAKH
jgi:hypothetical protein